MKQMKTLYFHEGFSKLHIARNLINFDAQMKSESFAEHIVSCQLYKESCLLQVSFRLGSLLLRRGVEWVEGRE